jgi:hypothetical protein
LRPKFQALLILTGFILLLFSCDRADPTHDPLPSWHEGPRKMRIISFVETISDPGNDAYVKPSARIAVFDNDGTLWAEKPIYVQLAFALARIREIAPQHPQWQREEPFAAVLKGDLETVMAGGEAALGKIIAASHSGMTARQFSAIVSRWLAVARHPETDRLYTEMVYQPMLELIRYLQANDFTVFIVSGGGTAFMRPWTEAVYGIPPHQVVGSSLRSEFAIENGAGVIRRLPEMEFFNDKAGKPVGIYRCIGRRPIAAFGNSDGDLEMLQYAASGKGERLSMFIHHTDSLREWAYDRHSAIGQFAKGLDYAQRHNWPIVDMASDWRQVYPPQTEEKQK